MLSASHKLPESVADEGSAFEANLDTLWKVQRGLKSTRSHFTRPDRQDSSQLCLVRLGCTLCIDLNATVYQTVALGQTAVRAELAGSYPTSAGKDWDNSQRGWFRKFVCSLESAGFRARNSSIST